MPPFGRHPARWAAVEASSHKPAAPPSPWAAALPPRLPISGEAISCLSAAAAATAALAMLPRMEMPATAAAAAVRRLCRSFSSSARLTAGAAAAAAGERFRPELAPPPVPGGPPDTATMVANTRRRQARRREWPEQTAAAAATAGGLLRCRGSWAEGWVPSAALMARPTITTPCECDTILFVLGSSTELCSLGPLSLVILFVHAAVRSLCSVFWPRSFAGVAA